MLEELDRKIERLLPKPKKNHAIQKLRYPLDYKILTLFLNNAGSQSKRKVDLRRSQLRICYTIIFHLGTRINKIKHLKYKNITDAIKTFQFNLIQHKPKETYTHILSDRVIYDFKNLRMDYEIVFEKYKYEFLFGKVKPIAKKV